MTKENSILLIIKTDTGEHEIVIVGGHLTGPTVYDDYFLTLLTIIVPSSNKTLQ